MYFLMLQKKTLDGFKKDNKPKKKLLGKFRITRRLPKPLPHNNGVSVV
jgi:hypothetical protein